MNAAVEVCKLELKQLIVGWSAVRGVIKKAPWTCLQWSNLQRSAFRALKGLKFKVPRLLVHDGDDYVRLWTCRTLMLTMMAAECVPKLHIDHDMKVLSFCRMNPDQNSHLTRLCYRFRPMWRRTCRTLNERSEGHNHPPLRCLGVP